MRRERVKEDTMRNPKVIARFTSVRTLTCIVATVTLATLAAGCGVARARTLGINEASRFRQLLNAEKYSEIYASASSEFKQQVSEKQWIAVCSEARHKLGDWKASAVKDTKVITVDSGGYIVGVEYATDFVAGQATENLSFFIHDGNISLRSYSITSPLLAQTSSLGLTRFRGHFPTDEYELRIPPATKPPRDGRRQPLAAARAG